MQKMNYALDLFNVNRARMKGDNWLANLFKIPLSPVREAQVRFPAGPTVSVLK